MSSINSSYGPSNNYGGNTDSTHTQSSAPDPLQTQDQFGGSGNSASPSSVPSIIANDPLLDELFNALPPELQQAIENMLPQIMADAGGTSSGQQAFNNSAQNAMSSPSPMSGAPGSDGASGTGGAQGASAPAPTGSTWSPAGDGPYKVNVTNSSSSPETVTLTGNGQQPKSMTLAPGQSVSVALPANFAGNISAQKQGQNAGPPTLFEFATGNGQGSNTSWDVSTIVGDNTNMHATAAGSSDVADSQSNTPGSHYIHWNDDQQRPSPVKNTTGTEMSLAIS